MFNVYHTSRILSALQLLVVDIRRGLVVARQFLYLLLDRRARLQQALLGADLVLNLRLPLGQVRNVQFILSDFYFKLLDGGRFSERRFRTVSSWLNRNWLCHSSLEVFNLGLRFDHIGMFRRIPR